MIKRLGFDKYSALYLWLLFMVFFGITKHATFLSQATFKLVIQENVIVGVLALAFLVPLATGTFDLAIGANMSMALVIVTKLAQHKAMPEVPAMFVAIGACALGGFVSGFFVVKLRVNSFIATLGMSQVISAFILHTSQQSINSVLSPGFQDIGHAPLFGYARYVYYLLILAAVIWFVFEHTPVGRYMFATGGNPEAARLAGVRTDRLVWGSLVASGAIGGFAGIIYAWKAGNYAQSVGPGYLFPAIAAVFFGASQLKGRANVWGTLIALYALSFGIYGLHLTFSNSNWIDPLFQGASLLAAVSLASRGAIVKVRKRRASTQATTADPSISAPTSSPTPEPTTPEPAMGDG
jgi:ribose transport system permease protein